MGRRVHLIVVLWVCVIAIVVWAYAPGLLGPFLFDDYGALPALGKLGGVNNWDTFQAYLLGGKAGPTGRPLSLLTFLFDAQNWPADPLPFKRTNLVIHLLIASLLFVFVVLLLRLLGYDDKKALMISAIVAAFWALHPFLVSTTLYVVQRMAQLSTLFMLMGLIGYLCARVYLVDRPKLCYSVMTCVVGICGLLALLSKENGLLLPVLILLLELVIIPGGEKPLPALNRYWLLVCLLIPAGVILLYLFRPIFYGTFFDIDPHRDFSVYERLITQARILVDYQLHWFLPKLYTSGVYQDFVHKSAGLLSPWTTLVSIVFHLSLVVLCWLYRAKLPILCFSILFFYVSHLLESTTVMLELYFEHRNYLASMFLILPCVCWLFSRFNERLACGISLVVLCVLAAFTRYSADIWGSHASLIEVSAMAAPESPRAQQQYSLLLYNRGQVRDAIAVADVAILANLDSASLKLWRLILACRSGADASQMFQSYAGFVEGKAYDLRNLSLHQVLLDLVTTGGCEEVAPLDLILLYTVYLKKPLNSDIKQARNAQLRYLRGLSYLADQNLDHAILDFNHSLQSRPLLSARMLIASHLASKGALEEAFRHADIVRRELLSGAASKAESVILSDVERFLIEIEADLPEG